MNPSPLRLAAAAFMALFGLALSPCAVAGGPAFVAAGPAAAAAGVNGYFAGALGEPGHEAWWCQVVATPALAGTVNLELGPAGAPVTMTVRHALSGLSLRLEFASDGSVGVTRDGVPIARLDAAARAADGRPLPRAAMGFRALALDPCWMLLTEVARDPRLGESLVAAAPSADCVQGCSTSDPVAAACTSPLVSLDCCVAIVTNNYCVEACGCATAANPTECRATAEARRTGGIVDCVVSFSQSE